MWNPAVNTKARASSVTTRSDAKPKRECEIEQDETRLRERLAEEEIDLIETAYGWMHAVRARRAA